MFCGNYREKANVQLEDAALWQRLTVAYRSSFRQFLKACLESVLAGTSSKVSYYYCLATTFLKGALMSKTQQFLAEVAAQEKPLEEQTTEEKDDLPENKEGENDVPSSSDDPSTELKQAIETIFAQYNGIVSRGTLKQQLHALAGWNSPKTFYSLIEHVIAKKVSVAIQKRERNPRQVRAQTYYVSPAYHKIDTILDFFRVIHNFIMGEIKNFLSVTCAVKDRTRLTKTGNTIINDLEVRFSSRRTYVEYTSGGREKMHDQLKKIRDNQNYEAVFVVRLEDPPRRRQSSRNNPIGIRSNKKVALEIADELGIKVYVFTLTNVTMLEYYCMHGKMPYTQR
ncbi:MAG: hypothetical protein ACE5R6_14595 [Candidatus Heimdallarchaeota archaeon]